MLLLAMLTAGGALTLLAVRAWRWWWTRRALCLHCHQRHCGVPGCIPCHDPRCPIHRSLERFYRSQSRD